MATKTKKLKKEVEPKATAQPTATAQPAGSAPQQQPGTDLSIADLKNLGTIIDVASTRGAFRANEMATVGAMYNNCLLYTSPSPRDGLLSRMPSSA